MLLLTQKKLQARIDQAIAQIPLPAPAKDWEPELDALRAEIASLKAERGDIDRLSATVTELVNRPAPVIPEPPEPVDLAPLHEKTAVLGQRVSGVWTHLTKMADAIDQTDDLTKYLLESPREIRTIREVGHTQTLDDPAAAPTLMVRPMGAL